MPWQGLSRLKDNPSLKDNFSFVMEMVKYDGESLYFASDRLKANKDVVITAVRNRCLALKHASADLRDDPEVVMEAVTNDGYALCI